MKKLFLSLIFILLVSGCTNLPFDIPFFSSQGPKVKELPPDVISIHNISVLPSTNVRENDYFSVYFEVLNQDELDNIPVSYDLYDTGLCNWTGGEPSPKTGSYSVDFFPRETRVVEWNFRAPSAEDIAHLRVTCPIRFKFDFNYQAKSQIDVLVMESDHLTKLQRSQGTVSFTPTLNIGRGPIKIYFDFGTSLPARDEFELPIYIVVYDKGTGIMKEIGPGEFTITFPDVFNVQSDSCPYFVCLSNTCANVNPIPIISKKSLEIRCFGIKTPSLTPETPEKTYFINAAINYSYYVAGEVNVGVEP